MDRIIAIQNSVYAHPLARELLIGGMAEQSYFATDPETGVKVRCRPDYSNHGLLIDLKTTTDASAEGFARSAYAYRYYQQAAFYTDVFQWAGGGPVFDFYFIAVEKVAPFAVQVFKASPQFIARGREAYRAALNLYADCLATGIWPGYSDASTDLELPAWAEKRLAMDDNPEVVEIGYAE
jgi:exodeoxyribonuclease VIII